MLEVSNIWFNAAGTIRVGREEENVKISTTGTARIDNLQTLNVAGNIYTTSAISGLGGTEIISSTISTSQNNWSVADINPSKSVHSFIFANATSSLKLTGFDTSGLEAGKTITIRNNTATNLSTSSLILLELNSPDSSAANRFALKPRNAPVPIMPHESIDLLFDGEELVCIGGTRDYNSYSLQMFDSYLTPYAEPYTVGYGADYFYQGRNLDLNTLYGKNFSFLVFEFTQTDPLYPSTWAYSGATRQGGSAGNNAILFYHSGISMDRKATSTNDYMIFAGTNCGSYRRDPTSNVPLAYVAWTHQRTVNADFWVTSTRTLNVTTNTVTSLPVTPNTMVTLGGFINGDATRVDWFYSTDFGNTWNFTTTSHTSNIPKRIRNSSNAEHAVNMCVIVPNSDEPQKLWWTSSGQIGGVA